MEDMYLSCYYRNDDCLSHGSRHMSWTALTAALTLVVIDFKDARLCLEKVSYFVLVFFCGMFVTVDGFNRTGIPSTLGDAMEANAQINDVSGIVVIAFVILILSNITSKVPTGELKPVFFFIVCIFLVYIPLYRHYEGVNW